MLSESARSASFSNLFPYNFLNPQGRASAPDGVRTGRPNNSKKGPKQCRATCRGRPLEAHLDLERFDVVRVDVSVAEAVNEVAGPATVSVSVLGVWFFLVHAATVGRNPAANIRLASAEWTKGP